MAPARAIGGPTGEHLLVSVQSSLSVQSSPCHVQAARVPDPSARLDVGHLGGHLGGYLGDNVRRGV